MPQRYTLTTAAKLLGISLPTLRRWLARAHITPRRDAMDHRSHWLIKDQIALLAKQHKLVLFEQGSTDERLAALELEVRELTQRLEVLERCTRCATLLEYEDTN